MRRFLLTVALLLLTLGAAQSKIKSVVSPHSTTARSSLRKNPSHRSSQTDDGNKDDVLIINIVGDTVEQLDSAITHALLFLSSFDPICKEFMRCRAFMTSNSTMIGSPSVLRLQAATQGIVQSYPPSLISHNIGSSSDDLPEHVSEVIFALATVEKEFRASTASPVALSLTFSAYSSPVAEDFANFRRLFRKIEHSASMKSKKVLLYEKNKDFTSPSDWHDLQIVVMALACPHTQQWIEDLQEVYFYHANRTAFSLREPRAAIMESVYSANNVAHVGFLDEEDVCVQHNVGNKHNNNYMHAHPLCPTGQDVRRASIPVTCTCSLSRTGTVAATKKTAHHGCACSHMFPPVDWKRHVAVSPTAINERVGQDVSKFLENLPENNKFGTARFRFTNESDMPQGYCWETGDAIEERKSHSNIYANASHFIPFEHPEPALTASAKIIILSATGGGGFDKAMDMSLSRMYYAHRHGYAYNHLVSEAYAEYFGPDFLDKLKGMGDKYPKNVMSKVPMIVSTMYTNMDKEWIMWMDDDTWFNPGWLSMPLDVYLEDVPSDKLVVLGNHRSAQSNVVFIRNNFEGRRLARDWLSIVVSGYVQCHGYDQGALEILIVSRLYEKGRPNTDSANNIRNPVPYNFTCLHEKWVTETSLSQSAWDFFTPIMGPNTSREAKHAWGCNGGADWSCDFKFEAVLREVGFIGLSSGFHMPLSSFSQGCANAYMPEFHITSETAKRPRLHVGFCSRLDEIQGTDFCYDGPIGGGNDYVRRFAVNGWMINHKADINYYEIYRDRHACRKSDSFALPCNEAVVSRMIRDKIKKNDELILLTGGYAYDFVTKQFCSGGAELLDYQKKETYMKFYPRVIAAAQQIEIKEWHRRQDDKIYGEYKPISEFKKYFQPVDYCASHCSEKANVHYGHDTVLHCSRHRSTMLRVKSE